MGTSMGSVALDKVRRLDERYAAGGIPDAVRPTSSVVGRTDLLGSGDQLIS